MILTSADVYLSENLFLAKMRPGKHSMDFATKRSLIVVKREMTEECLEQSICTSLSEQRYKKKHRTSKCTVFSQEARMRRGDNKEDIY